MLNVGSLFSGVGGIDIAAERAGMRVLWQCDIDPEAQRVLRHHWPEVERHGDIRTLGHASLRPVDVVCGGVPCQDWSVAGRRKGLAGERSGLFFDFVRLADALAPRWLVFENVPGLLSAGRGRDFATVLGEITGYCPQATKDGWRNSGVCAGSKRVACWRVLDARFFGVPQRRRRVFLVASAGNAGCVEVLFEPEGSGWHPAPGGKKEPGVTGKAANGTGGDSCFSITPDAIDRTGEGASGTAAERSGLGIIEGQTQALRAKRPNVIAHTLRAEGADASEDGTGRGTPLVAFQCHGNNVGPAGTLRQGNGGLTGGVPFIVNAAESCAKKDHAPESDTARCLDQTGGFAANQGGTFVAFNVVGLAQQGKNHAYETEVSGCVQHKGLSASGNEAGTLVKQAMLIRRLTPTECLRLQGLPDSFLDLVPPLSDSVKYRLIGNSVAVPCVEWIMRRLVAVDAAS